MRITAISVMSRTSAAAITPAPRSAIGLSFTGGREMAFFGSLGALNTPVHGIALHAEHEVKHDWSFNFNAGYYEHGAMPSQKAIRFTFIRGL